MGGNKSEYQKRQERLEREAAAAKQSKSGDEFTYRPTDGGTPQSMSTNVEEGSLAHGVEKLKYGALTAEDIMNQRKAALKRAGR